MPKNKVFGQAGGAFPAGEYKMVIKEVNANSIC